ncbi:uncharacterized protein B0H18DRAFT_1086874 [Fomitopsis serialis]|uniref:uncharacterized protein n=1 Tax=Fomitopsis serialis TaxID=139415 RepID=UPI0020073D27|nr:uncharacterized protein B0H18DRAFT_1086874 [Neoantrodia serialis]KAH9918121.1 hypothetical protein B0H18DRAFT_1086874 [Neoantrodia serialis]
MSTALQPAPSAGYALAAGSDQSEPQVIRRDTDNILSYYQSEHAGRTYLASDASTADLVPPPSAMRTGSGSSSEYSSDSRERPSDASSSQSHEARHDSISTISTEGGHRRRPSVPSEGGADRRRLAIVELDDSLPASLTRKRSQASRDNHNADLSATTTISSRRGMYVEGLALVAPPDASPRAYTDLTPPSTAPLSTERPPPSALRPPIVHQRSQSDITTATPRSRHQHKSSRDIGIVGAVPSTAESIERPVTVGSQQSALKLPIFQTPTDSRSPTPGSSARTPDPSESSMLSPQGPYSAGSSALTTPDHDRHDQEALTPAIGESKEIGQPVVGPVIVNTSEALRHGLQNRQVQSSVSSPGDVFASRQSQTSPFSVVSTSRSASPYVHYDPGTHSRAGPMPAPPHPLYDVDPRSGALTQRDPQALRDALQLPQSVSAVLASKVPSQSPKRNDSELTEDSVYSQEEREPGAGPSRSLSKRSMHVREGAHPPSTVTNTPPTSAEEVPETKSDDVRHVEAIKAPPVSFTLHDDARSAESVSSSSQEPSLHPARSRKDLRRESSWVSMAQERVQRALSPGRVSNISRSPSTSPSMFSPTPPPKSIHGSLEDVLHAPGAGHNPLKGALTNLKRFSALPRTPSLTSARAKSPTPSPQASPRHSESRDAPLPVPPVPLPVKPKVVRPRIKAAWPEAMACRDVMAKRNPLERSIGYAHKINELALYDCGLTEWVQLRQFSGEHAPTGTRAGSSSKVRLMVTPATPASRAFVPQPRHTSRGSEASGMTHPPTNSLPPPALPYPSLAQAQQTRSPIRSSTMMPSPSRSLLPLPGNKSSGGFFSSIGRKASVRKDRPVLPPNPPGRVLSKRNTATPTPTPLVQVASSPNVPGGPRAAPGRVRRSQTFSAISGPPPQPNASTMPTSNSHPQRQSTMRRPSLFARAKNHGQSNAQAGAVVAQPALPDPEFDHQVDKLADLLPHADRGVLAGYLRRAGQDILAIGQYLEDEKNGTLRRD